MAASPAPTTPTTTTAIADAHNSGAARKPHNCTSGLPPPSPRMALELFPHIVGVGGCQRDGAPFDSQASPPTTANGCEEEGSCTADTMGTVAIISIAERCVRRWRRSSKHLLRKWQNPFRQAAHADNQFAKRRMCELRARHAPDDICIETSAAWQMASAMDSESDRFGCKCHASSMRHFD